MINMLIKRGCEMFYTYTVLRYRSVSLSAVQPALFYSLTFLPNLFQFCFYLGYFTLSHGIFLKARLGQDIVLLPSHIRVTKKKKVVLKDEKNYYFYLSGHHQLPSILILFYILPLLSILLSIFIFLLSSLKFNLCKVFFSIFC